MLRSFFLKAMLAAVIASLSVQSAQALSIDEVFAESDPGQVYVQGNLAGSFTTLEAGGFNNSGTFRNGGGDDSDRVGLGGAIGLLKDFQVFRTRLEVEGMWRDDASYVTPSFPGAPPFLFMYQVDASKDWSVMTNLWFDLPVSDHLLLYGGGGIGAAGTTLFVSDTVVAGKSTDEMFAWQVGAGVIVPIRERIELDLGYRYLDAGTAHLRFLAGSGTYSAKMCSSEIMSAIRIKF